MGRVDHRRPWEWVYSLDDGGHWGCSRAQPVSFTQCPSGPPGERAEGPSDGKPSSSRQLTRPQRLPSRLLQGLSVSPREGIFLSLLARSLVLAEGLVGLLGCSCPPRCLLSPGASCRGRWKAQLAAGARVQQGARRGTARGCLTAAEQGPPRREKHLEDGLRSYVPNDACSSAKGGWTALLSVGAGKVSVSGPLLWMWGSCGAPLDRGGWQGLEPHGRRPARVRLRPLPEARDQRPGGGRRASAPGAQHQHPDLEQGPPAFPGHPAAGSGGSRSPGHLRSWRACSPRRGVLFFSQHLRCVRRQMRPEGAGACRSCVHTRTAGRQRPGLAPLLPPPARVPSPLPRRPEVCGDP